MSGRSAGRGVEEWGFGRLLVVVIFIPVLCDVEVTFYVPGSAFNWKIGWVASTVIPSGLEIRVDGCLAVQWCDSTADDINCPVVVVHDGDLEVPQYSFPSEDALVIG